MVCVTIFCYNHMTSLLPNSRRPDVSFHPNGRIDITARIAKMLHLEQGDVIDVAVGNEEYLLYVRLRSEQCVGRHEAQVYPTNRGGKSRNFRANSRHICSAIIKASNCDNKAARLPAGSPIIYGPNGTAIPLITRNPINHD